MFCELLSRGSPRTGPLGTLHVYPNRSRLSSIVANLNMEEMEWRPLKYFTGTAPSHSYRCMDDKKQAFTKHISTADINIEVTRFKDIKLPLFRKYL